MSEVLLITPPFTQLNTPYPATAYIKGFLYTKGIGSFQMDLGIEVILELFSKKKLEEVFETAYKEGRIQSENTERIYVLRQEYLLKVEDVIRFLQGENMTLARVICSGNYLPKASRFVQLEDMEWAFGSMGMQDRAKHLATLFLEDISDFIIECVDPNFGFSRYAERIGMSANSFDELYAELQEPNSFIDDIAIGILAAKIEQVDPKMVLLSVPFPGNLFSAFRCAQWLKQNHPELSVSMGGGYPNTELRSLKDPRVFEFMDYVTLDDGELPVELLYYKVSGSGNGELKRAFLLADGEVVYQNNSSRSDYKMAEVGTPDYTDLLLNQYISVIEVANPMHSLWSDGRWNKLTMAHGCYWGKCTFCDVSLDYIKVYEPVAAKLLVDRVEQLIEQTGETGFHFVDEAAPPSLMKAFALEVLNRGVKITWWTNIRFEKNFSRDLCLLLAESGCIAVSGGLEVASDRLLALIDKGVTVEQVAKVTGYFTEAGIMVHSYLMYGYPTQTVQETVDSLEMVRQLFEMGIIQSGFWHQFALTAHSPVGKSPQDYGVTPVLPDIQFAHNDLQFTDNTGIDHNQFSDGLKKSLYNYMHQVGFEFPLQDWFDQKIPQTTIAPNYIEQSLQTIGDTIPQPNQKVVWLGADIILEELDDAEDVLMICHTKSDTLQIETSKVIGTWLQNQLKEVQSYKKLKESYPKDAGQFEMFWFGEACLNLRANGVLLVV